MEYISQYHQAACVFVARIFLGVLFLFQGYDAVFKIKIKNIIATYRETFAIKGIPGPIVVFASWFTSLTELIGGVLLIPGLFKYVALYLLSLNMIMAAIGFGINTPMWDNRHMLPRLLLLLLLLAAPLSWDAWSIDMLIGDKCSGRNILIHK